MKFKAMTLILSLVVAGCGAAEDGQVEDVGELEQELYPDASTCGATAHDASGTGTINVTSPQTYGKTGCPKAFIARVNSLTFNSDGTYATWADAKPTSLLTCQASYIEGQLWTKNSNGVFQKTGSLKTDTGNWSNGQCIVPSVSWFGQAAGGLDHKFIASARTSSSSSASTRKVRVWTHLIQ